jgi:hypothetical protein
VVVGVVVFLLVPRLLSQYVAYSSNQEAYQDLADDGVDDHSSEASSATGLQRD